VIYFKIESALQHKNIVQYLGVYTDERRNCFIVTELMTAGDLKTVLVANASTLTLKDLLLM
jgi:serine/threonine protein kinase